MEGLQFLLPDAGPKRTIRIHVVDHTGKPVEGATVSDVAYRNDPNAARFGTFGVGVATDANGWLTIETYQAAAYRVSAISASAYSGQTVQTTRYSDPVEITPGGGPLTIQLLIHPLPVRR